MRKLIFLFLLLASFAGAQTALPSPPIRPNFLDLLGHPLAGGFLYTYDSGTSTPEGTWTDFTGTVANTNPILLDSYGFPQPGGVWLTSSLSYRFCLQNSSHVQQYCIDGIAGLLPTSTGGSVTNVTASAPLASSGGAAPNITASVSGNGVRLQSTNLASPTASGTMLSLDALGNTQSAGFLNSQIALLNSPSLIGIPTAPTAAAGTNNTQLATTAFAMNMQSPTFTGSPHAPTQAVGDNSTKIATTAYVDRLNPPQIVFSTPSAATTGNIGSTTMATAGGSGNTYRANFYVSQTALGVGCGTQSTIAITLVYTDPNGAGTQNLSPPVVKIVNNGVLGAVITINGTNPPVGTLYNFSPMVIVAKAGTTVTYSTVYTPDGGCSPNPTYKVFPILEQVL